ncbi:MAG: UDP-N-acetylglucosamine 1-carboxyvinyltransferase, partial [Clostridiales bacterium]|nr:UDP-N-acetylglucosamine 1-carboxyvinyltransferase [Clostridiales bacterium]
STSVIKNCPDLSDVRTMVAILKEMGCKVTWEGDNIIVDSSTLDNYVIPQKHMKEIRSSVFLMGPTLARCGKVSLSYPGGCAIGERPIDIHLYALRLLGVDIKEIDGLLECSVDRLIGTDIHLPFPSVGATENAMMAAIMAEGETRILNPAKEPEIADLQNYLNSCGAEVYGAGTDEIVIKGKRKLRDTIYKVIPDRIEGGTFLAAVAATGGSIYLKNTIPAHMSFVINKLREAGCKIIEEENMVYLKAPDRLKAVKAIETSPYPGFPTDMQSQFMAIMSCADGYTFITENIFENRFKHVNELIKMGANIQVDGKTAIVKGVEKLKGAHVKAMDLRGGASLVIAGLTAEGITIVENICHIDRGYDKFELALNNLGADIKRI